MGAVHFVLEHPFACGGVIVAILYAWSTFGTRRENQRHRDAGRVIRTFGPSVGVLILVIAASTGLKENLPRVDFGMFYSSALLLKQDPNHLYDSQTQTEYLHAVTGLKGEEHYLPFAYPPFVAFLFRPMTALSFQAAYYVMIVFNLSVLGFTFWWLSSKLGFRREQLITFVVVASGALPLYSVFVLGHLTFVGMLLLSLYITDLINGRNTRAGVWVGLMLFKPILFPLPFLTLLWKKQWRALTLFAVTASALLGLSLALVGRNGLAANIRMMRLMSTEYLLPRTHSLRGLAFFMHIGATGWILLSMTIVAGLWFAFRWAQDQRWVAVSIVIAVLLITPYLQYHDLTLGLVGLAVVLAGMHPIADKTRSYLFLLALVPAGLALAGDRNQPIFPIMPVVLSACFVYCLAKAFGWSPKRRHPA